MSTTDPLATFRAAASPEQRATTGEEPAELTQAWLRNIVKRALAAQERAEKASHGPWWASANEDDTPVVGRSLPNLPNAAEVIFEADWGTEEDATFAAAAREDVPVLAAAVLALSAEVRRLRGEEPSADDLAAIEAAAREDKAVASRATARPWKWWTANSRRELRSEAGRSHEMVAFGQQHPIDHTVDIAIQDWDIALIERAVNGLEERADALLRLAGEVRSLRGEQSATARDTVTALLLRRGWYETARDLATGAASAATLADRVRRGLSLLSDPSDGDRACVAALEALASGEPQRAACGAPGPRGLRCGRQPHSTGDHEVETDAPPLPCDMCSASAGEDCADPKACRAAREQAERLVPQ